MIVNSKRRRVAAGDKLDSKSKMHMTCNPALQSQSDPLKRAVEQLARKELLQFASAVRSRICRGTPNRESKDASGFADKVDKHIQTFLPYLQHTGVTAESFKSHATASFRSRSEDSPTDEQLRHMAEDCREYVDLMHGSMMHECNLAVNFDWVRSNLFTLS